MTQPTTGSSAKPVAIGLFDRTGWDIRISKNAGDTTTSDPARPDRDERCFALLASRYVAAA